jgi:hypothetical protein
MKPFLFVTDLDNTLVGDDAALTTLNRQLAEHRENFGTKIVYATGRSLYLYRELAREKFLLSPDALITSVGTEIYFQPDTNECDREWATILSDGWHREKIATIADSWNELTPQPESEQNPFKISYYLAESLAEEVLPQLKATLVREGFKVKLVYSGSQDLDLLPQNGDKGLAVQFLRQKWNVPPEQTVACGDSGNDIALFRGDEKGIIVGNAQPELHRWYKENQNQSLYLAESVCAGGILEGLKYFEFLS